MVRFNIAMILLVFVCRHQQDFHGLFNSAKKGNPEPKRTSYAKLNFKPIY